MKKHLFTISALLIGGLAFGQTTILQEDFESGLPGTWTQSTLASDGGWLAGTASSLSSSSWAISTANASDILATNDDGCDCDKSADRLISPLLNLSAVSGARLSVDVFYNEGTYSGDTEEAYIQISTNGGSTWTNLLTLNGDADWRTEMIDLSSYAGQSNVKISFLYKDNGGWLFGCAIDNFHVYEPAPVDAEMTSLNINPYVVGPGSATIAGTITNLGTSTITSVSIDWNDGTSHPQTFSVSIAPLATYNFTHGTTLSVAAGTNYNVDVTATVTSDANSSNNTLSTTIYGLTFQPTVKVVGEEGTGTWCGWCPRGAVFMDQMANDYPTSWIGVAVHNGDPMTVTAYDAAIGNLISGYPSGVVDRIMIDIDPSQFPAAYADRILVARPAGVTVTNGWNSSTRALTVNVTANYAATLTGINWRLAAIVVEDDVTGTASGYNQTNYYAGGSNGVMGGFESLPDPVPAAQMVYNHVGRSLLGGFSGQSGSIPTSVTAGGSNSYTFNYTVPAAYDETQIKLVGLIIDQTTGEIINANEVEMALGVTEQNDVFAFGVYPNPANDIASIKLNIKEEGEVSIDIYNIAGTLINSNNYGSMSGTQNFILDASKYEAGVYFVNVTVNGSVLSKKMIITH